MPRNKFDKDFQGKSLTDLQALKPYIDRNVTDFKEANNVAMLATYRRIQEALNRAIAGKVQQGETATC